MSSFKNGPIELAKMLSYSGLLQDEKVYKIICPFHEDINPSMIVDLNEGNFFCFGCQRSGKAFDFFKFLNPKMDELDCLHSYFKALKSKGLNNVKLRKEKSKKLKRKDFKQLYIEAKQYYTGLSKTDWHKKSDEKDYLVKRGLNPDTLIEHGAKININENYPVIFPIIDNWKFKGWVCRTTDHEVEKKRKYLYNKGFRRANTVAGIYQSKTIVLVEGYIDFLKARQLGIKNVAAILGWKISENQIEKLKLAGVKNIVSALDNDEYGDKGTTYLRKYFNVIRFEYPKGCKDFGDLDKKQFIKVRRKTKRKIKGEKQWA